jgi:GT2 family glycosyltransferase
VLSLTRDRLEYTQHCFASLQERAGCDYDHFVLDQHSRDGTQAWLVQQEFAGVVLRNENVGIARGMNVLLDFARQIADYDVVVKFDNDCELTQPNTLRDVAALALEGECLLSPRILGLNNPPSMTGMFLIGSNRIMEIPQIGGIFLAAPASLYDAYRYPDDGPVWGMDDANVCSWWRMQGGRCGYVERLTANHYETTSGQHTRYPAYFQRTLVEGKPAL